MDALLSLLLFTGFIFVIMRLATAHGVHDHPTTAPRHASEPASSPDHLPEGVDPMCGRKVAAHEGVLVAHAGVEYRFCSLTCLEAFERRAPMQGRHAA